MIYDKYKLYTTLLYKQNIKLLNNWELTIASEQIVYYYIRNVFVYSVCRGEMDSNKPNDGRFLWGGKGQKCGVEGWSGTIKAVKSCRPLAEWGDRETITQEMSKLMFYVRNPELTSQELNESLFFTFSIC